MAAAPHEAEPLDPVVRGHGGVPHSAAPVVHALPGGEEQLRKVDTRIIILSCHVTAICY